MPRTAPQTSAAFRLRASLLDSDPEIWRELEVDAGVTLAQLHDILQTGFGWSMTHLHSFTDRDPFVPRHGLRTIGKQPRDWALDDMFTDLPENALSERVDRCTGLRRVRRSSLL